LQYYVFQFEIAHESILNSQSCEEIYAKPPK